MSSQRGDPPGPASVSLPVSRPSLRADIKTIHKAVSKQPAASSNGLSHKLIRPAIPR